MNETTLSVRDNYELRHIMIMMPLANIKHILLISGKAHSGKDTANGLTKSWLRDKKIDVDPASFAHDLKVGAFRHNRWNGKKDEPGRRLIAGKGDLSRQYYDLGLVINCMEDFLMRSITFGFEVIGIDDVRFPNEIDVLRHLFGRENISVIRIIRDNTVSTKANFIDKTHITETALDKYTDWDYIITNNSTHIEFEQAIEKVINSIYNTSLI